MTDLSPRERSVELDVIASIVADLSHVEALLGFVERGITDDPVISSALGGVGSLLLAAIERLDKLTVIA